MKVATVANLVDAFEDLGFTIDDPKAIDRLVSFCDIYGVDEAKLSCEYLAFASHKKLLSEPPTLAAVESFEKELAKTLLSSNATKATLESVTSNAVYDSSTLPLSDTSMGASDLDDSALNFYGTPRGKVSQQKRQLTPDNSATNKRHAVASIAGSSPVTFSPTSFKAATPQVGRKYSARGNGGQVLIRFDGNAGASTGTVKPATFWKTDGSFVASVANFESAKSFSTKSYRYMFERMREKAGFLDETICRISEQLASKYLTKPTVSASESDEVEPLEPLDFCQVMPEPFPAAGRICCDASEGRLNAKSIVLQGSQDICRGRTLPFDASAVSDYSLFPGQIVLAKATNPNGSKLVATNIWSDANAAAPPTKIRLNGPAESLDVVIASGPYSCSSDLDYEPLKDLLTYVVDNRPHVLILCGPFVDERHPMIESGHLRESFDAIFGRVMTMICEAVADINTQVVIVPSHRDAHHLPIFPTPPFDESKTSNKLFMASDPCMLNIEGVLFGLTATDILFHLGKEEISFPPHSGDRLRRLANHLVQQQSFYPLFPPNEDVGLDLETLEAYGQMPVQPHVLVLPSDLLHFFKDLNGCLVTNPQRLVKGESGGVFARIKIQGLKEEDSSKPFVHRVHSEIVRI